MAKALFVVVCILHFLPLLCSLNLRRFIIIIIALQLRPIPQFVRLSLLFWHLCIRDFSHHACPLFDLTKSSIPFSWEGLENMAFEMIKKLITSAPVLIAPDEHQPF